MSISVNVTPGGGSGLSSGAKVSVVTGQGLRLSDFEVVAQ